MSPRKESGDVSPALQICFRGWADFCTPRTGALQIALFGGLETPKVLASGRPLLAHVDSSIAREVDRPLRRAMLNKSRLRRHYFSIEPRTLSGLDPPSRATRIGSCIFPGQKIPQKIQKTVLHLFSGLVTSAQNVGDFRGKNRGNKKFKKIQKKVLHLFFNLDTSASIERLNQGRNRKNTP